MHAWTQKGGVPEEAKIGRTITRIEFFTCALGAPRSASILAASRVRACVLVSKFWFLSDF